MSATAPGEVRHDTTYTLDRAQQITGLGKAAFRAMRRDGLPVRYVAGRGFVSGKSLAEFIEQRGKDAK